MADRDLLNKPLPLVIPEERNVDKRGIPAPILGKLGVQVRAREVGTEADAPKIVPEPAATPAAKGKGAVGAAAQRGGSAQTQQAPSTQEPRQAAFRAAYFNRDVGGTKAPNLRAKPMAALRGEEGATDLKRVVLPPPSSSEAPQPEQLGGALARMLPTGQSAADGAPALEQLIAGLSQWTQQEGMTQEKLQARMEELEALVATRKAALERMAQLTPEHLALAHTLTQAIMAEGEDPVASPSLIDDANTLVRRSHDQADGLHLRLKKVMGIKGQ